MNLFKKLQEESKQSYMSHVRPQIKQLVDSKTVITCDILNTLRMNSYEQELIYPLMDDECLIQTAERFIKNCSVPVRPCATYNEAIITLICPLLIERLRNKK